MIKNRNIRDDKAKNDSQQPNILFIMVDQMQYPRYAEGGFDKGISDILGFKPMDREVDNEYTKNYPGFMALRKNAVVLKNHRIATSACVPSRTAIFSGQYGTKTGSTQTDGIFKSGTDRDFPWLKGRDMPTIGSYMREAGYNAFYMGKWHVSGEKTTDLEDYGFSNWELSYPDPHGYLPNNLGFYRDYQFRDLTTSFLRRQGLGQPYNVAHATHNSHPLRTEEPSETPVPWFAVCSFANPHDIASYPGLPSLVSNTSDADTPYILKVPKRNTPSNEAITGTMQLKLNHRGLKQNNSTISPTWEEDVLHNNKPDCQFDYSYKMGVSLMASPALSQCGGIKAEVGVDNDPKIDGRKIQLRNAVDHALQANENGVPLAMTGAKEDATTAFMQYYAYLISEVDQHIKSVLDALEESGQADNTIVIFCPDHGEYAGAHHMMTEKWSTGYDEVLHVPMIVRFPESYHAKSDHDGYQLRQIEQPTSHVDILPTILGLAGADQKELFQKMKNTDRYGKLLWPVGADLSDLIKHNHDDAIAEREGILFINYDTITEPLDVEAAKENFGEGEITPFEVYCEAIDKLRLNEGGIYPKEVENLARGSVRQPCYVHCVVDTEGWKLVRYFDLDNDRVPNQYELYNLNDDNTEQNNLVVYNDFPHAHRAVALKSDDVTLIEKKATELKKLMDKLEKQMLDAKPEKLV